MQLNSIEEKIRDAVASRHEPEAAALVAHAYWTSLVSFLALVTVGAVAFGAWEFMRPLAQDASDIVVGSPKAPLNRAELQVVLDGFDMRNSKFDERLTAPAIPDPS